MSVGDRMAWDDSGIEWISPPKDPTTATTPIRSLASLKNDDDSDSTVVDARDRRTNGFAAAVLALWTQRQAGVLTQRQYEREVQALLDRTQDELRFTDYDSR